MLLWPTKYDHFGHVAQESFDIFLQTQSFKMEREKKERRQ